MSAFAMHLFGDSASAMIYFERKFGQCEMQYGLAQMF